MRSALAYVRGLLLGHARERRFIPAYDTDDTIDAMLAQFDESVAPWFTTSLRRALDSGDAQTREWFEEACGQALDAITVGLPVYGKPVGRLGEGFRWAGPHASPRGSDVLHDVQPHRFAFLPRFALAVLSGRLPAAQLRAAVQDWVRFAESSPALPFISNLVVAQRLFACTWTLAWLGATRDAQSVVECRRLLMCVTRQDIEYLRPRLGKSYPNNHLLVDRFTDWFIACVYPGVRDAGLDVLTVESAWLEELEQQTYEDGGGFEHSVHYHAVATEMATTYLVLKRAFGAPVASSALERIARMLRFQADLCGPDGAVAAIGDGTDDRLIGVDAGRGPLAAAFREAYRALFDPGLPACDRGLPAIEWAFWLLGGQLAPPRDDARTRRFIEYPDSGLAIFLEHHERTRCTFRSGPMSHVPCMPGHAHADLLSVTLTVRGVAFLADPGTFTYRFDPGSSSVNWRAYFMGATAHNGLAVRGIDPLGGLRGDFRNRGPVSTARHISKGEREGLSYLEAIVDGLHGYPRLIRGIVHLPGSGFIVYNVLPDDLGDRKVSCQLQFVPGSDVCMCAERTLLARRAGVLLALSWSSGCARSEVVKGRRNPVNGWVSRSYGQLEEAPQLLLDLASAESLSAIAMLYGPASETVTVDCLQPTADARAMRISSADTTDYVFVNVGDIATPTIAWDIRFSGRLLWLHVPRGGCPGVRWVDGISCDSTMHGALESCTFPSRPTRETERRAVVKVRPQA
jgi:hypothetical protein